MSKKTIDASKLKSEALNATGNQDCTLELDSSWIIDAR